MSRMETDTFATYTIDQMAAPTETIIYWSTISVTALIILIIGFLIFHKNLGKTTSQVTIPFTFAILILSAIALSWAVSYEFQRYHQEQLNLAQSTVQGVVRNISQYIRQKREIVEVMAKHEKKLLLELSEFPVDEQNLSQLQSEIDSWLVDSFGYMLADSQGNPLLTEKLHLIGPNCKKNIQLFSQSPDQYEDKIVIHGTSKEYYHIDVMVNLTSEKNSPIFFVSFKADDMVNLLQSSQAPGQALLLVMKSSPQLIEMSSNGIRPDSLFNKPIKDINRDAVIYQMSIADTGWDVMVIPEEYLFSDYKKLLNKRALFAYSVILIIAILFLWRLWHEEKKRKFVEDDLYRSYEDLENKVKIRTSELENNKRYLENIFLSAPYGMIVTNDKGNIESVNHQTEIIFDYKQEELLKQSVEMLLPEHLRKQHIIHRSNFKKENKMRLMGKGLELMGRKKNGEAIPIEVGINSIDLADGNKFILSINDISVLYTVKKKLMEEHERAIVTLASIGDGVIATDISGSIQSINAKAEMLTGWNVKKAKGTHITEVYRVVDEKTREVLDDPVIQCLKKIHDTGEVIDKVLIHKDGKNIPVEDSVAPIYSTEGHFIGIVLVFHDVSQARQYAHEITYQAKHDALTGLLNRREFDERLHNSLKEDQDTIIENVLLFMDLDRFKLINDTAGHAAGDELLIQLTSVLSKQLRHRDTFARLGGDEFGVLLENCNVDTGLKLANKLRETVEDFKFYWNDQIFNVGVSIGMMPYSSNDKSANNLLSEADAACYIAKESGKNRVQLYDAVTAKKINESHIVNLLTRAFEKQQMRLYQQRIKAINTSSESDHYELLLRMIDDEGAIVPPKMFLPAAERYGLATNIDRWVIRNAFQWLSEHRSSFQSIPCLAINVSGQSMTDSLFCDFVEQQFLLFDIEPRNICFEITETAAMHNLDKARTFVNKLKQLGCRFSLDDFGSGQAAYAQLKHLPVDYLKIDGSLITDILDDKIDFSIVKSINEVGHVLGFKTIAEFVQNEETAEKLASIGIDFLQGYGIAYPEPIDELLAVFRHKK